MLAPETRLKERYRILEKIGGGGFGHVYKAVDEVFGCGVAIKETREEVSNMDRLRKAFEREAKLLHSLKHDSLPRVTDYFFHDRAQFLVMDFIEGEDLAARLKKRLRQDLGPFTCQELLPWADKILAALEYLHGRPEPVIHRDIKPSNIKLTDEGEVYLLDFGLAKGVAGQMSTVIEGQTASSVLGFTREYAPLEQLHNTGTEAQSDIYALGATIYHLLTGRLPVLAPVRDEALQKGQGDPLLPAHEVNPAVPLAVSQVISRAMAVRWWDRFAFAREMRAELKRACEGMKAAQIDPAAGSKQLKAGDERSTLRRVPLHEPGSRDGVETVSSPAKELTRPRRFRRPWLIAGLALVFLAGLAAAARLALPQWFAPAVENKPAAPASPPENPKPSLIVTPTDLKPRPLLTGHKKSVWTVAFSPDGSLAASGSEDATVILWETKTWEIRFPLKGHAGPVYSVAFSPDGKILASSSLDATIRLWDTQTGELIRDPLSEGTKPALRVAFSPDGNLLASSSGSLEEGGDEIRLWYVHKGWASTLLPAPEDRVLTLAFSPDSRLLATTGFGNFLRLWNLKRDGPSVELRIEQLRGKNPKWDEQLAHAPSCIKLAFSADGKYLACGSSDTTVKLWLYQPQTQAWTKLNPLVAGEAREPGKSFITTIAFSPDNKTLISASMDGELRLWDVTIPASKLLSDPGMTLKPQRSSAFSPDGQTLITGGDDNLVRVWQ